MKQPQSILLKDIQLLLTFIGIGDTNFKQPFNAIYAFYAKISAPIFVTFVASQLMEVYYLSTVAEYVENLAPALLYAVTCFKVYVSKTQSIKNFTRIIHEYEHRLTTKQYQAVPAIYVKLAGFYKQLIVVLTVIAAVTTVPFFIRPFFDDWGSEVPLTSVSTADNVTVIYRKRSLPISSWVPFQKYKHYYATYLIQVVGSTFLGSSTVLTDLLFLGFMLFLTVRIRIFNHRLRNIRYCRETEEQIQRIVHECIVEHQEIIKNVKHLDEALRTLMLIDCIVCSLQIASVTFWIIVSSKTQIGISIIYLFAMMVQLFLFYGFADNIMFESVELSTATWSSDWYNCSKSTKRSLFLIMLGCKKPLCLSVGSLYPMSNEIALTILKTAYSYIMLFFNIYTRDN